DVTYDNVKWFSVAFFLNPLQAIRMFLETGMGVYSFGHMSRLMQSFLWVKPGFFLAGNLITWLAISFLTAIFFHRKEAFE
ncbi:MAG: copper ABC transporter permease, partial [Bacillota bacterium]|nr:copper ABC transporter permease [Bacillota bacterium]